MPTDLPKRRLLASSPAHPFWMRLVAVLGVLLIVLASVGQAAHRHGDWLPHQDTLASVHSDLAPWPGEAGCPLCVAMHSALPAKGTAPVSVLAPTEPTLSPRPDRVAAPALQFSLFSRPPPASALF